MMPEPEASTAVGPAPAQGAAAFLANLGEGWRIACMRAPHAARLHFSWGQLLALIVLNFLLGLLAQIGYIGLDGQFQPAAMPDALFFIPELILAWFLGCMARDQVGPGPYLIALLALAVPVNIANAALFLLSPHLMTSLGVWLQWSLAYLPLLWFFAAAALAAVRIFAFRGWRAWAAALAAFALLPSSLFIVDSDRWLWVPRPDPGEMAAPDTDYFASVREDHIYRQQQLLTDALAKLEPGQPGRPDIFLVAAAGYAAQDVFMKEVNSVTQLFDERFGTQGRSLRLINNAATSAEVPMASKTALQQALQRIAGLMDRDEDILFLFMTSHGSKEHKFSLDFGMLRFNDIDPAVLRKLLDDSGITRRVIVISACYSGGFVDALRSDHTLVITAAAADRNSFGCSNENDYTYFGKAYFDEALRQTYSFTEAFALAKPLIAAREKAGEETPSEPQMALGKDIAPVLDAFARERAGAAAGK